jgi:hypothetical protein
MQHIRGGIMKTRINLETLIAAYRDPAREKVFFLDKVTGALITISLHNPDLQELKKLKERIAKEPGRYPQIPKRTPHESYTDMESFIKTLKDIKLQKRLIEAIEGGQGAFRSFRDVLEAYPREKQTWNTFNGEINKKAILAFLREAGIPKEDLP